MILRARVVAKRLITRPSFLAQTSNFENICFAIDDRKREHYQTDVRFYSAAFASSQVRQILPTLWVSPHEMFWNHTYARDSSYKTTTDVLKCGFKSFSSPQSDLTCYDKLPLPMGRGHIAKASSLVPKLNPYSFDSGILRQAGKYNSYSTGPPGGTASSSSTSTPSGDVKTPKSNSRWERFIARLPPRWQDAWRRYGSVFIVTYFSVYFSSIGILFFLFDSGLLLPGDLPTHDFEFDGHDADDGGASVFRFVMARFGLGEYIPQEITPRMGNFAIAWLTTKIAEPLRALLTLGLTPLFARALGRVPSDEGKE